jgi:hypothetical protein
VADQLSHGTACNGHVDFKTIADDGGGNHLKAAADEGAEGGGDASQRRSGRGSDGGGAHLGLGDFLLHLLVALSLKENSVVQLLLNLALGPFLLLAPAARLCNR